MQYAKANGSEEADAEDAAEPPDFPGKPKVAGVQLVTVGDSKLKAILREPEREHRETLKRLRQHMNRIGIIP